MRPPLFRVIAADPPWPYEDKLGGEGADVGRAPEAKYDVLSLQAIRELPVAPLAAPDSVLLLWTPAVYVLDGTGRGVMRAWGFEPKQLWVWVKTSTEAPEIGLEAPLDDVALAFGLGRLSRNVCEFAIVGSRGRPLQHLRWKAARNVFLHPNLRHSQKPDKVQDQLDRMFPPVLPSASLELFGRRSRAGWTVVGNESPATKGQDIHDSLADLTHARTRTP